MRMCAVVIALALAACGGSTETIERHPGQEGTVNFGVDTKLTTPAGSAQGRALCATLHATLFTWYTDSNNVSSWKKYWEQDLSLGTPTAGLRGGGVHVEDSLRVATGTSPQFRDGPPTGNSGSVNGGSANYVGVCYDTGKNNDTQLVVSLTSAWYCDGQAPALQLLESLPLTESTVGTCAAGRDLALPVDFEITQIVQSAIGYVDIKATVGVTTIALSGKQAECDEGFITSGTSTLPAVISGVALTRQTANAAMQFVSFETFDDPNGAPVDPHTVLGQYFASNTVDTDFANSYYSAFAGTQTAIRVPLFTYSDVEYGMPAYMAKVTSQGTGNVSGQRCTADSSFTSALLTITYPFWGGTPLQLTSWAQQSGTQTTLHIYYSSDHDWSVNHINPTRLAKTYTGVINRACQAYHDQTRLTYALNDPANPTTAPKAINCTGVMGQTAWTYTCGDPVDMAQAYCQP